MRRMGLACVLAVVTAAAAHAQEGDPTHAAYFAAVAEYFEVAPSEISILRDWRLPSDEIPVVLFVARRAGVSPEALVALRRSGTSWAALAGRYQVGPSAFHIPLAESAPAGRLEGAFTQFRGLSPTRWDEVRLTDSDIVALVNTRVLSESAGVPLREVLARAGASGSFADLYGRLVG